MKQTLKQAIAIALSPSPRNNLAKAATILSGKPEGGWAETAQAKQELLGFLPFKSEREYTMEEFIEAMYKIEGGNNKQAGIYRTKY